MTGTIWILSYVLLWVTVLVLGVTVVALLRQIGLLHTRVAPMGVHFAGEGPELDRPAPELPPRTDRILDGSNDDGAGAESITVLAFTSPTCEICASLRPGLRRMAGGYDDVEVRFVDHGTDPDAFGRFRVRSTPYLVAIDGEGIVRSRGVANTLDQAEEMLAEVRATVAAGGPIVLGADGAPTGTPATDPADDVVVVP
ncbi:MAG: hypothetical protein AAGD35_07320 [Actinomycetota bacterium]